MDSDCNPSSSAGVLFTTIGFRKLPDRFNTGLDEQREFSHTAYNFPRLLDVCEKLARQFLAQAGRPHRDGRQRRGVLCHPGERRPQPSKLELSWAPGPIANSRFTPEEMAQIKFDSMPQGIKEAVTRVRARLADQGLRPGHESRPARRVARPQEGAVHAPVGCSRPVAC